MMFCSSTLLNHCFHEIQRIRNIKIDGLKLVESNDFDSRIDFPDFFGFRVRSTLSNFWLATVVSSIIDASNLRSKSSRAASVKVDAKLSLIVQFQIQSRADSERRARLKELRCIFV